MGLFLTHSTSEDGTSQEDPEDGMLLQSLSTCEGGTRLALDKPRGPRRWDVTSTCLPVREGPDQLLASQEDPEGGMLLQSLSTCEGGTRLALDKPRGPRRWDVKSTCLPVRRTQKVGCYTPSLPVREGPDQLLTSQEDPEGAQELHSLSTCEGGTRPAPEQPGGPRRCARATLTLYL